MVYMKKTIAGIGIIACVALCAAVWPRSAEVGDLPAEPINAAVPAEIEARPEETPHIYFSADMPTLVAEVIAESEPQKAEITTEKETEKPAPTQTAQSAKPNTSPTEPHNGDVRVVDGEKQVYLLGFGWIKDEGGGSVGTTVGNPGDELTCNKVGIMGGTVGSKGDINKQVGIMGDGNAPANSTLAPGTKKYIDGVLHVWVPGFGYVPHSGDNVVTYAEDMYESGVKIGIMGDDEPPSRAATTLTTEQPEPTGDVIYTELQPPVTKDSTPPAFKPNGEPYNP
jgi:hypothetical protein